MTNETVEISPTEKIEIGPTDIAKLLHPIRGTIGEIHEQLVERVQLELGIDNETHARYVVDFLEATKYLSTETIKGPEDYKIVLYNLTQKGRELIQKYL